jgi:deoxyribodipyrimidine photo-lyase
MGSSILWFRQDLRLHDNEALLEAIRNADQLIPVYIIDPHHASFSTHHVRFLIESLTDLRNQLRALGSDLLVRIGSPEQVLYQLALDTKSQWVYCNRERTRDEVEIQDKLEKNLWTIGRELRYTRGKMLYYTLDLPFPVTQCPDTFVAFKKEVEHFIPVRKPLEKPTALPPLPSGLDVGRIPELHELVNITSENKSTKFIGGETVGLKVLDSMITHPKSASLDDENEPLSPWISMGCLSPKLVFDKSFSMVSRGEGVRLHLLYRDYLRLMGKKYGDLIFFKSGIMGRKVHFVNDEEALLKWKQGKTGVDIIDAAMHQLNLTGWMPDVLRRLTANYFINVLRLDWRSGAAYFESQLIDYDPCSNWVSWLNLSGFGPDSREDRTIHYDLAGKKLDPEGTYIASWNK